MENDREDEIETGHHIVIFVTYLVGFGMPNPADIEAGSLLNLQH